MRITTRAALLSILLAAAHTGCTETSSRIPLAPSPGGQPPGTPQTPTGLLRFNDTAAGFSTTDVRDVDGQIIQFNGAGELIWTADGSKIPGYPLVGVNRVSAAPHCQGCALEVRFGITDGERRAYLTFDYGHSNSGMVVDLEVAAGQVTVIDTDVPPPGTFTLSGMVFEMTPEGPQPLAGATVSRLYGDGWQNGTTDEHGIYAIRGLYKSNATVSAGKPGYRTKATTLAIDGDTRFDIELVR